VTCLAFLKNSFFKKASKIAFSKKASKNNQPCVCLDCVSGCLCLDVCVVCLSGLCVCGLCVSDVDVFSVLFCV